MKPHEFRRLYAIPYDIAKRRQRIERLEILQADGPQAASDVVKSSHGEGNSCVLGHVTVTGTADSSYNQRAAEILYLEDPVGCYLNSRNETVILSAQVEDFNMTPVGIYDWPSIKVRAN